MSVKFQMQVVGNLGRDVEARYTPSGKMVASATVACTVGYGESKRTEWIKAVLWEKSAELFQQWAGKGTKVLLVGTPKLNVWTGKDGEAKGEIELTVHEFEILKNGREREATPYDKEAEAEEE